MNDSTPPPVPSAHPPREQEQIMVGPTRSSTRVAPESPSRGRDRAADSRDADAQDRDRAAEFRDRAAEKREARLVHDLDAVDDGHEITSPQAPLTLGQKTTFGGEWSENDGPAPVREGFVVAGCDGLDAGGEFVRGVSGHEHGSVLVAGGAARRDDEDALLEDVLLIAKEDRLDAARDRERADADREDAAGDRREGARQRATARHDRDKFELAERSALLTLESMSDAFFTLDSDWRFTYLNPQTEAILERRREDLIGKSMWAEFPDGVGSRFDEEYRRALREQTPVRFDARHEPLGRILAVRIFPAPDGLAVYFSDVTTERLQEERLRQGQRLEAIGQATAGVAHDFGNILAVVRGFAQLGQAAADSEKAAHYFTEIDQAGAKAAELTRQLLAFARQQDLTPTVNDLNDVVADLSSMLGQLVTPGVEIRLALSPEPVAVFIDRTQLDQVLVNLIKNSNDAIDTTGTITVTTSNSNPAEQVAHEREATSGWLHVRDDGSGIPTDVMPHIFDPFFSTKSQETGTGLGLATIYGIVSQSGGSITVESTLGAGTTMTIELPTPAADSTHQATTAMLRSSS